MIEIPEGVSRHHDAAALNAVVNHPGVRPWVGAGSRDLDLSEVIANPANILLMGEGGGILFMAIGPGIYEMHTQFVPEARGKNVIRVMRDATRWMFTRTDCVELQTKIPDGNLAALSLVRVFGGEFLFHRKAAWPTDTGMVGAKFFAQTIHAWAGKNSQTMETGHWFHDKLEAAKLAKGSTIDLHDDDDAHDRYVGATVEMVAAGQTEKAVWFYNKWAVLAGYASIRVIADNPPIIDIQDTILAVRPNDFEVLLCR